MTRYTITIETEIGIELPEKLTPELRKYIYDLYESATLPSDIEERFPTEYLGGKITFEEVD